MAHLDYLDEAIPTLSDRIEEVIVPFAEPRVRLDTVPGMGPRTAEVLIAELGVDMARCPGARQLASWAGLCPDNNESAGKHKSGKTRKGNRWLRAALVEAALAAIRTEDCALGALYRRIMREPGAEHFDRRHAQRVARRAIQALERQGYRVTLAPTA